MSKAIKDAIPKNLLFRYRLPCREVAKPGPKPVNLPPEYRIEDLGQFESQASYADVRMGWSELGVYVSATITGKKQTLWCRETALLESDGLQLWIDTRDTHNVHRASKFCHWFVLMPTGHSGSDEPFASTLKINRSRETSPAMNKGKIVISSKISKSGYSLSAFIPAASLHGWDAAQHQTLGFNYVVSDRELGVQSLALGSELPIDEDPSLWQSLSLV